MCCLPQNPGTARDYVMRLAPSKPGLEHIHGLRVQCAALLALLAQQQLLALERPAAAKPVEQRAASLDSYEVAQAGLGPHTSSQPSKLALDACQRGLLQQHLQV